MAAPLRAGPEQEVRGAEATGERQQGEQRRGRVEADRLLVAHP